MEIPCDTGMSRYEDAGEKSEVLRHNNSPKCGKDQMSGTDDRKYKFMFMKKLRSNLIWGMPVTMQF